MTPQPAEIWMIPQPGRPDAPCLIYTADQDNVCAVDLDTRQFRVFPAAEWDGYEGRRIVWPESVGVQPHETLPTVNGQGASFG